MQPAFDAPLPAPVALGDPALHRKLRHVADVPPLYRGQPAFLELAHDPARGDEIQPGGLREAIASLEAVAQGLIVPPPHRPADAALDLYDGAGHPFDVKSPVSPQPGERWRFEPWTPSAAIEAELANEAPNLLSGAIEPVRVLLDISYMTPDDTATLRQHLADTLSQEAQSRVIEVSAAPQLAAWFATTNEATPAKPQRRHRHG